MGTNAAEIIATSALLFTAYQTHLSRKHNRLSVKPHITTFTNRLLNNTGGVLTVSVLNNGLGPAFVTGFTVYLDNNPIDTKQPSEVEQRLSEVLGGPQFNFTTTYFGTDYAMRANEDKVLLHVHFPALANADIEEVEKKLKRFDLVLSYKSAYGETFTYDSRKL